MGMAHRLQLSGSSPRTRFINCAQGRRYVRSCGGGASPHREGRCYIWVPAQRRPFVPGHTPTSSCKTTKPGDSTETLILRVVLTSLANSAELSLAKFNPQKISSISHTLKEPLTSIKGYSQLLLENYREKLSEQVLETVKNIFEQSVLLEKKIINILDNIKVESIYDVLLIEDDLATIRLITSYFDSKGYKCEGVVSGSKGLEELGQSLPKLILLDIILPDLSGYDICKTIKSDNEWADIPVYFLTAIAGSEVEKNLKDTNANGYILKPFNFSDFEIIFNILDGKP